MFKKQKGSIVAYAIGAVVIMSVLAVMGSTMFTSVVSQGQRMNTVAMTSQAITQAAYALTTETTTNGSGNSIAPAFLVASPNPSGGGQIPATSGAPKVDAYGTPLGYCTNAGTLQGDPILAVVSAGVDKTFDTTCANALAGTATGDDKVIARNVASIRQGVGGTVFFGDPVATQAVLDALNPVRVGELRVVLLDGSVWVNKTGTTGLGNWAQISSAGGSSPFVDDIGLIVQASYPTFNTQNPKFLRCNGAPYLNTDYPTLSPRMGGGAAASFTATARTLSASSAWSAVAYGNGMWVAVSSTAATTVASSSPDGITWTARTMPSANSWQAVIFAGGQFVAVGGTASVTAVATSPNGITWTSRTTPNAAYAGIAYGGGLFVAIGTAANVAATSPDGITWTARTMTASAYRYIAYGNDGQFIAVGPGTDVATSPDGLVWTTRALPAFASGLGWRGIAHNGALWAAISNQPTAISMTSPDGITWTQRAMPSSRGWKSLTYGGGLFLAGNDVSGNVAATSPDGITWTQQTLPSTQIWFAGGWDGTKFLMVNQTPGTAAATIVATPGTTFNTPDMWRMPLTGVKGLLPAATGYYFVKALP